jgi:hypothetical protein
MTNKVIDSIRETERAMRVQVNLSHDEIDRLTVNRLITIRNSNVNKSRDMEHFDKVLRHFLTEEEFNTHVIGNKPSL